MENLSLRIALDLQREFNSLVHHDLNQGLAILREKRSPVPQPQDSVVQRVFQVRTIKYLCRIERVRA